MMQRLVLQTQRPGRVVQHDVASVGAYVHIPFCARKCGYCDFNAYSGYKDATKARYVDALCAEIAARAEPESALDSVFFGGGTPTQLAAPDLGRILNILRGSFALSASAEVTVEANPSDVDVDYLSALRAFGVNRLSFGAQSFDNRTLKLIDRNHDADDIRRAVAAARDAGFANWSMDLIFGLPRQSVRDWRSTLESALELKPPHLSVYGLTIEEHTPFHARIARGRLTVPGDDAQAAMLAYALARLPEAGLRRYEISNHSRAGHESVHNRIYWDNGDYFGFGAGAAGYRDHVRTVNVRRPSDYIRRIADSPSNPYEDRETLDPDARLGETIMLGLRRSEGIGLGTLSDRFGVDVGARFRREIETAVQTGWAERVGDALRLTDAGVPVANEVMALFV